MCNPIRDFTDETFFCSSVDRSAQSDVSRIGDDLHVLGIHGHVFAGDNFFANLRCGVDVGLAVTLIERRESPIIAIANIARRVIWPVFFGVG